MSIIRSSKSILSLTRSNFSQIKGGLNRLLNTSCSINHQISSTKTKEECPMASKQYGRDPNELHCTPEEWANAKPFDDIPGPKPLPIIGNTWRFLPGIGEYGKVRSNLSKMSKMFVSRFGEIIRLRKIVGLRDSVFLYDPAEIEKVYKLEGIIPERDILPSMTYYRQNMRQDLFQDAKGLLTSHGKDWYNFRNKVNTIMMQPKIIKQYISPIDNIANELIERIKSIRGEDNKISEDFWKELNKWALESIACLAVNSRLGCLQGNLPDDSIPAKMIQIAEDVFTYSAKLDFEPSPWKYISTPAFRKTMKIYDEQTTLCEELIKLALKEINEKKSKNDLNDEFSEPSVLEKLLKIDEKVAIVMALDMLVAGVDSTSTALLNILYYLAINKPKQEILKKEILELLPDDNSVLNADMLNSMPYLKACIKEAARMYPVTPGTMRYLTKDAVLSGYQVPKGTWVLFIHYYISNSAKHYPRPQEYIPERWLRNNVDSDISYKKVHPFSTMHFGFGSRSCIGRRFAELELEVAVINFMRHFNLSWEGQSPRRKTTSINYLVGPFNFIFENAKK